MGAWTVGRVLSRAWSIGRLPFFLASDQAPKEEGPGSEAGTDTEEDVDSDDDSTGTDTEPKTEEGCWDPPRW